jgi:hypothetical protein
MLTSASAAVGRALTLGGLEAISRTALNFSENDEIILDLEAVSIRVPLYQDRLLMVGLVSAAMFTLGVQYSIHHASLRFEAYIAAKTAGRLAQSGLDLKAAQAHLRTAEKNAAKSARLAGLTVASGSEVALVTQLGLIQDTARGLDAVDDSRDVQRLTALRSALQEKAAARIAQEQISSRAVAWRMAGRVGGRFISVVGWIDLGILLVTGATDLLLSEQGEKDLLGMNIEPWSPLDEYVIDPAIQSIWGATPESIKETVSDAIHEVLPAETLEVAQAALLMWFIDTDRITLDGAWPIYLPAKYATAQFIDDLAVFLSEPVLILQLGFYAIILKLMVVQMFSVGLRILRL